MRCLPAMSDPPRQSFAGGSVPLSVDDDHELARCLVGLHVAVGVGDLVEGERAVDVGAVAPGLHAADDVLEHVAVVLPGERHAAEAGEVDTGARGRGARLGGLPAVHAEAADAGAAAAATGPDPAEDGGRAAELDD